MPSKINYRAKLDNTACKAFLMFLEDEERRFHKIWQKIERGSGSDIYKRRLLRAKSKKKALQASAADASAKAVQTPA